MEFFDGTDLMQYAEKNDISEELVSQIMKELFSTMLYIHQSGIIHRDIKPENILVQIERKKLVHLKLIDFGLSCYETEL